MLSVRGQQPSLASNDSIRALTSPRAVGSTAPSFHAPNFERESPLRYATQAGHFSRGKVMGSMRQSDRFCGHRRLQDTPSMSIVVVYHQQLIRDVQAANFLGQKYYLIRD